MICQSCQKHDATVHQVQVKYDVDGNPTIEQRHICQNCAKASGLPVAPSPQLPNVVQMLGKALLGPLSASMAEAANSGVPGEPSCPECGWTPRDFRQTSRFGCPNDYDFFSDFVENVLEGIHGYSEHARPEAENQLEQFRQELEAAILTEDYETAARLRDTIRELEQDLEILDEPA
jgi:protein arginine kinase activator